MVILNIEKMLKERGKSRYWLVKKLDSDYTTVNNMLNNETSSISFKMIEKLAHIFECDFNDIFMHK